MLAAALSAVLLAAVPPAAAAPAPFKSQSLCGLTLDYPSSWLLLRRDKRNPECPYWASLSISTGRPLIEITQERVSGENWIEEAARRIVICDADGPEGGRTCDIGKGRIIPATIAGRRAVEASAPIIETRFGGTATQGEMRGYAVETSTRGSILILRTESGDASVREILDNTVRGMRPAVEADAALDARILDAAENEKRLLAAGPESISRESDGFRLVARRPDFRECVLNLDFDANYSRCYPENLPARLHRGDIQLAYLTAVHISHVHPFEVRGDEVFFIKRAGEVPRGASTRESDPWTDELWALDLKTGRKELAAENKGLFFHASGDGRTIYYSNGSKLWRLDRDAKATTLIYSEPEQQLELGEFRPDGTFGFCVSIEGDCVRRGKVVSGAVIWDEAPPSAH